MPTRRSHAAFRDAFDVLRAEAAAPDARGFVVPDVARNETFRASVNRLDERFAAAHRALGEITATPFSLPNLFDERFGKLAEPMDAQACALALCEHHEAIQRAKSAAGKRPWFDRIGGDRIYIRQAYRSPMPEVASAQYLHTYRGEPIRRFSGRLGMSPRRRRAASGVMLELWRPPENAGEPVGCLASTYTFRPGLFDEQCLARFLEIESEPDREDLAFLLERESRLGSVYAAFLVDHTQAGVEHSLRWDVLPVRVRAGKQHAKLSLLAWSHHIRIIVASANLTEPGYRTNHEVAATVRSLAGRSGRGSACAGDRFPPWPARSGAGRAGRHACGAKGVGLLVASGTPGRDLETSPAKVRGSPATGVHVAGVRIGEARAQQPR